MESLESYMSRVCKKLTRSCFLLSCHQVKFLQPKPGCKTLFKLDYQKDSHLVDKGYPSTIIHILVLDAETTFPGFEHSVR